MSQIYLEILDMDSLTNFIQDAKERTGLLKDISIDKLKCLLGETEFPIRIPVNLESVIELASNPVVKKIFGKKIEDTTMKTILKVIEAE